MEDLALAFSLGWMQIPEEAWQVDVIQIPEIRERRAWFCSYFGEFCPQLPRRAEWGLAAQPINLLRVQKLWGCLNWATQLPAHNGSLQKPIMATQFWSHFLMVARGGQHSKPWRISAGDPFRTLQELYLVGSGSDGHTLTQKWPVNMQGQLKSWLPWQDVQIIHPSTPAALCILHHAHER